MSKALKAHVRRQHSYKKPISAHSVTITARIKLRWTITSGQSMGLVGTVLNVSVALIFKLVSTIMLENALVSRKRNKGVGFHCCRDKDWAVYKSWTMYKCYVRHNLTQYCSLFIVHCLCLSPGCLPKFLGLCTWCCPATHHQVLHTAVPSVTGVHILLMYHTTGKLFSSQMRTGKRVASCTLQVNQCIHRNLSLISPHWDLVWPCKFKNYWHWVLWWMLPMLSFDQVFQWLCHTCQKCQNWHQSALHMHHLWPSQLLCCVPNSCKISQTTTLWACKCLRPTSRNLSHNVVNSCMFLRCPFAGARNLSSKHWLPASLWSD